MGTSLHGASSSTGFVLCSRALRVEQEFRVGTGMRASRRSSTMSRSGWSRDQLPSPGTLAHISFARSTIDDYVSNARRWFENGTTRRRTIVIPEAVRALSSWRSAPKAPCGQVPVPSSQYLLRCRVVLHALHASFRPSLRRTNCSSSPGEVLACRCARSLPSSASPTMRRPSALFACATASVL